MKANKAPERIWIDNLDEGFWFDSPSGNKSIEYTRTDAFIEKACEYLQINLWRVVNEEPDFRQRFVTDFRYYMKGE